MNKLKNSFYGAKTHFKMYKKGRQWLVAGVTVMSIGLGVLGLNTVTASAATAETPVAAQATEQTTADTPAPVTNSKTASANTEQPATDQTSTTAPKAETTTPETTNLGDATAQEVEAAKTKATADYQETGQAQTVTAVAAESAKEFDVSFHSTVQTDKKQVLSEQNSSNKYDVSVDEGGVIKSATPTQIGEINVNIPDGYQIEKVSMTSSATNGQSVGVVYDVAHKTATLTSQVGQLSEEQQAYLNQEVAALLDSMGVNPDKKQFTIKYDSLPIDSVYDSINNKYDFTFQVVKDQKVSLPYQTQVKTTDGTVLSSQNATNTYVASASSGDSTIFHVTNVYTPDLTDTIPNGYHLTGIQIVDTSSFNHTVLTVTYDPSTGDSSTGIGNIVLTISDPATGQTVTTDYSKDADPDTLAAVTALALQTIKQIISPDPTVNGNQYTASFENLINANKLLNTNVNQHSTNTVITYLVAGQPNQGGSSSGNVDNQGSSNSATDNDSTNTTNPNPETTTDDNSATSNNANTETTTDQSKATNDQDSTDVQSNASGDGTATSTGKSHVTSLSNATNGGTAVTAATTGANQVAGSKINGQTEAGTLPQTNEDSASQASALLGLGLLASFAGLFGISRRKKEQQ
ncbi:KxYKxGKxW signal peptide domain-containing protein [Secundilactobacillus mixtipabuli]|uniref:Gram-positive cocci surface proteins LPxTG domain-containing protein n=1 Tax=Secundilactobacillus mixtipabuli TaxID=1435342 RepID=A0A1Z5IC23_9LACO|nr:KxYKxGKxW signal peptide domain-containing protein [Secundilactobacillus mixtipabuli]GAW99309.1 hypothetical protein IWT30_01278 [Secundilactobacillus mixtipabuli]